MKFLATRTVLSTMNLEGGGVPPADVGLPGDVYLDLTFPYIIYFVGINAQWDAWNPQASDGLQPLARHPNVYDRYLWISVDGLAWLTKQSLDKSRVSIHATHTIDQARLAAILSSSPSNRFPTSDCPENQRRTETETQRRLLNGVPIGMAPQPTQPLRLRRPKIRVRRDPIPEPIVESAQGPSKSVNNVETNVLLSCIRDLEEREKKLATEVETLKQDNCGLQVLLDAASRKTSVNFMEGSSPKPMLFSSFITLTSIISLKVERICRDLKRKCEEEVQLATEGYKARLDQAYQRIKDLENSTEEASIRELELTERLNKVQNVLLETENGVTNGLPVLAAIAKEIGDELAGYTAA
ncbi:hypothetical protein MVEN_02455500 [Mycena venus]|uniref:Uncharacterized protein n=1 Tax=Mycena venus TaxID=2733690 RepID=A0A8H6WX22_9AGAR|nr:hypothetical protein MVEN_02455500 [Mycena venus]